MNWNWNCPVSGNKRRASYRVIYNRKEEELKAKTLLVDSIQRNYCHGLLDVINC